MSNTAEFVSTGKPKVTGGIYRAPKGTTLPTDASTALAAAFESFGYIASGGVTQATSLETNNYKAWGGDLVMVYQTDKTTTFAFGLIEILNPITYKTVNGDANVTGTLESGIAVRGNAKDLDEYVYVIELLLRGGAVQRIVIPNGKVTEIGDIVYSDDDAVNFPVTITAQAGSDGDSYKEYIYKAPAST